MRFVYLLLLLIFLAVLGVFGYLNRHDVPLHYPDQHFIDHAVELPVALVMAGAYLLGMLSGWSVVGFLRRSIYEVTERRQQ